MLLKNMYDKLWLFYSLGPGFGIGKPKRCYHTRGQCTILRHFHREVTDRCGRERAREHPLILPLAAGEKFISTWYYQASPVTIHKLPHNFYKDSYCTNKHPRGQRFWPGTLL